MPRWRLRGGDALPWYSGRACSVPAVRLSAIRVPRSARTSRARRGSCPRRSRARRSTRRSPRCAHRLEFLRDPRPIAVRLERRARPPAQHPAPELRREPARAFDFEDLCRALHRPEVDHVGRPDLVDRARDVGHAGDPADPLSDPVEVRPEGEHVVGWRRDVGGKRVVRHRAAILARTAPRTIRSCDEDFPCRATRRRLRASRSPLEGQGR